RKLRSALKDIGEAVRYTFSEPLMLGLLLLMALPAMFVMPFVAGLMPVLAAEVFKVGPTGLGALFSAMGAGALLGNLTVAAVGTSVGMGRMLAITSVSTVVFMALLGFNQIFGFGIVIILVLSASFTGLLTLINAAIQVAVKDEMRGRIGGLMMVVWGISPLGFLLSGLLAEYLGVSRAILIATAALAVFRLAIYFRFKVIRHF
ncbi:MAG: MFS transporter, partial [Chloroflexi bacterium]|nr:MFS transporter [Chloroflexota bacterium]